MGTWENLAVKRDSCSVFKSHSFKLIQAAHYGVVFYHMK